MPVKRAPPAMASRTHFLRQDVGQAVGQHVHADMDAGAHTIGGAELGHPDEHVDAQLLGPAHVEAESQSCRPGMRQPDR